MVQGTKYKLGKWCQLYVYIVRRIEHKFSLFDFERDIDCEHLVALYTSIAIASTVILCS